MAEDSASTSGHRPVQASANTPSAAAGAGASQAAHSSFQGGVAAGGQAVLEQDTQKQAPKEAKGPRPKWETAEDLKDYWRARKTLFTDKKRADAWEATAKIVQEYSDDMVKRWNGEIDGLLVYAGLFSAIQTAFIIEFYKRLTPSADSSDPDPALLALERISAQLSGFAMHQAFVNSTQPPFVLRNAASTTPDVPLWVIVLNALWFLSLILSLAAAFIGIMVKQWLTEYQSGVSGTERQTARLRQLRLNSLQRWRVAEIVSVIPVLLQLASGLFFAGLVILLWNLNRTVAVVGTVFVGLLAVFSLSTIILPSIATHCPYLSPPSRLFFELTRPCRRALYPLRRQLPIRIASLYDCGVSEFDHFNLIYSDAKQFWSKHPRIYRLCTLLFPRDAASTLGRRGMESTLVSRRAEKLDGEMLATAYKTSMDTNYLRYAAVCTTELTPSVMRRCFRAIQSSSIKHWGQGLHQWPMRSVHPCMWSSALVAFMTASDEDPVWTPSVLADALKAAFTYIRSEGQQVRSDASRTRLACVDITRIVQHCDDVILPPDCKDIAQKLLRSDLRMMTKETAETQLGNDVRHYVGSTLSVDQALRGLCGTVIDDSDITRALHAVQCIIRCIPAPGSPDYKPDDPVCNATRERATHALGTFSYFLSTAESLDDVKRIGDVFDDLREYGERTGLMSAELMRVIISYLVTYETTHGAFPWWSSWYEFIEELNRKLAEIAGQNAAVAVMESTLRRTEGPLAVDGALLTRDDNLSQRFFHALRCIMRCIPPLGSLDYKPDDSIYKAARERADHALKTFADFLYMSAPSVDLAWINGVFYDLREHGEPAGLMTADLRHAIVRYREEFQNAHKELPMWWNEDWRKDWFQKLKRELEHSEQNARASNTALTSGESADPLNVIATPASVVSNADSVAAAPQPADNDDDAHSHSNQIDIRFSVFATSPSSSNAVAIVSACTGGVVAMEDTDRGTAEGGRGAAPSHSTDESSGVNRSAPDTPPSPGYPGLA